MCVITLRADVYLKKEKRYQQIKSIKKCVDLLCELIMSLHVKRVYELGYCIIIKFYRR